MRPAFLTRLVMTPTRNGHRYELTEPLVYRTASGVVIEVPAGYVTDLASIPRFFWRALPPFGRYTAAAVVHDWLCEIEERTSDWAADVFVEAMAVGGVPRWQQLVMSFCVRVFGPKW